MLLPALQLVCGLCAQPAPAPLVPGWTPTLALSLPASAPALNRAPVAVAAVAFTGSLSTTIALPRARKLTLSATPSPTRCAPLLELAF